MVLSTAILLSALVAALGSTAVGVANAKTSYDAQTSANKTNVELTRETNAQNQYNIEHAHQIEMADLKAAGLNPVLTASGGNGAPITSLNTPQVKAASPDLSGIQSAFSGFQNMAMMAMMMENNAMMAQERNNTLTAIANGRNATASANAVLRNETLSKLYQRKANMLNAGMDGLGLTRSAKQVTDLGYSEKQIEAMAKIVKDWPKHGNQKLLDEYRAILRSRKK